MAVNRDEIAPELIEILERLMDEYGPLGVKRTLELLYAERAAAALQHNLDGRGGYLQHKFVMTLAGHLDAPKTTLADLWDLATMLVNDVQR